MKVKKPSKRVFKFPCGNKVVREDTNAFVLYDEDGDERFRARISLEKKSADALREMADYVDAFVKWDRR